MNSGFRSYHRTVNDFVPSGFLLGFTSPNRKAHKARDPLPPGDFPPGLGVEEGRKRGIFSFPREFLRKKEEEFFPFFLPFLYSSLLSSQFNELGIGV